MKEIKTLHVTLDEANRIAGRPLEPGLWSLLLRKLCSSEIQFDPARQVVVYPEFIPFKELVEDVLSRVAAGEITPRTCGACRLIFDVNEEEGIFGDLQRLENFLCLRCSEKVSAREFYEKYLKL